MDNLEKTDKFLEINTVPRLNQEEIENTKRPITSIEIETVILKCAISKSSGPDGFTREFYKTYKKELISFHLKLFQKTEEYGTLPTSSFDTTITLLPKQRHCQKRKL